MSVVLVRGGGVRVVERESGRVVRFPSFVSSDSIMTEYDQVVGDGFAVNRHQR